MIKLMEITIVDGRLDSNEVAVKKFDADSIIEHISETFDNDILEDDIEFRHDADDFVVACIGSIHTDDGDIDIRLIGRREDFSK